MKALRGSLFALLLLALAYAASGCSGCGGDSKDSDHDGVSDKRDNCVDDPNEDQADQDEDGLGDVCDNCQTMKNPDQADADENGIGDVCEAGADYDGDGVPNGADNCPLLASADQTDHDGDRVGDACDSCPTLPNAGQENGDTDTFGDTCDNCPSKTNEDQLDQDLDGVGDLCDNCLTKPNHDQTDQDGNQVGDACETGADTDSDGINNLVDNCPFESNADQADIDQDEVGDRCDNCPLRANTDQLDFDNDRVGDGCDNCPFVGNGNQADTDQDGIGELCDNCPDDANPDQADGNGDRIGDACSFSIKDFFPPAGFRGVAIPFTLTGLGFEVGDTVIFTNMDNPAQTFTPTGLIVTPPSTIAGLIPADPSRPLGIYHLAVTSPDQRTATLQQAYRVSSEPPPSVTDVVPPFAWKGSSTDGVFSDRSITIAGTGFLSTPGVRWVSKANPNVYYEATSVAYTDATTLSAIVPCESARMPAGDYTVQVINPDQQGAAWSGTFVVKDVPPPTLSGITPVRSEANGFATLTVNGANFAAGAEVQLLTPTGFIKLPVTTQSATQLVATSQGATDQGGGAVSTFSSGAYPVKVINPDGQWDVYYVFSLTPSSDGHITATFAPVAGSVLQEPRWRHGATWGFDPYGAGYIYVLGGANDTGNINPLSSVEYAQVSLFGVPGVFRPALQFEGGARIANQLQSARTGVAVAHLGRFLYAIGGSALGQGNAALKTIELARILGNETIPYLSKQPRKLAGGSLPLGSWYYRVSAVTADGEGLPSQEAVAKNLGGKLEIRWTRVTGATSYNVYRSLASDGRAQSTRLLKTGVTVESFVDDGEGVLHPASGNLRATGAAGGSLLTGSWTYRVTAVVSGQESVAGYALTAQVAAGEGTLALRWDAVQNATYKVYRTATVNNTAPNFLLASGLATTAHNDTGSVGVNTAVPAPDGIAPLSPGSLSRFRVLPAPQELSVAREGGKALVVAVDNVTTGPRTFLYVGGGRSASTAGAASLPSIERFEIDTTNGQLSNRTPVTSMQQGHAFFALLTSQGRSENPVPTEGPPNLCGDVDGDGHADILCGGDDCNDNDSSIHPGAAEICGDGVDQNCDGADETCACLTDADHDGNISTLLCGGTDCCDLGTEAVLGCTAQSATQIHPGATEICGDGIDQDCDGIDAACNCADADGDGYRASSCGGDDCNDGNPNINPGVGEICGDGIDQNCDGMDAPCGCPDADSDGYTAQWCGGTDCNDNDPLTHPGAPDDCSDAIDQNCDGWIPSCYSGGTEPIFLIAAEGAASFQNPDSTGTGLIEACTVSQATATLGDLSAWVTQDNQPQALFGLEGLLYFNFLSLFGGTTSDQILPTKSPKTQIDVASFDSTQVNATTGALLGSFQSTGKNLAVARAYFALVRLFSSLIAIGGANSNGVLDTVYTTQQ